MATTTHYGLVKPSTDKDVDEEFYQLQDTLDTLDGILHGLDLEIDGKAPVSHGHALTDIIGLIDALNGKMSASMTFKLDSLTDVDGADAAPNGYVLVKTAAGWVPASAATAMGNHNHTTAQVNGLDNALEAKLDDSQLDTDAAMTANSDAKIASQKAVRAALALKQNISDRGILGGFRNKIINGDFDFWQRGTSQNTSGFGSADRWSQDGLGSTIVASRQAFASGQTAVPGNPSFFLRTVVTSVAGASNYRKIDHKIEGVKTLAGKRVTLTFWAKADAARNMSVEFIQIFGTGGSPSAVVTGLGVQKLALTTAWQKFSVVADIPSIAGKTLGTNGDDLLSASFWFDAGSSANARTNSLGQQSGTFDIAHVSLVEGDASAEDDPFSPRHSQQELALCQRYFCEFTAAAGGSYPSAGVGASGYAFAYFPVTMRAVPTITPGTVVPGSGSPTGVFSNTTNRSTLLTVTQGSTAGNFFVRYPNATADAEL